VTICIAIRCLDSQNHPAILFAADRQGTKGPIAVKTSKLQSWAGTSNKPCGIVFAQAGDGYLGEEVFWDVMDLLGNEFKKMDTTSDSISIELLNLRKKIGSTAFEVYKKYLERARLEDPRKRGPSFELMIGSSDDESVLLHILPDGKTHYCEHFQIIGQGQYSGGYLLLTELFEENMSIINAAVLSSLVIKLLSKVDVSIGSEIDYRIVSNGKATLWGENLENKISQKADTLWVNKVREMKREMASGLF
jgi:hypothetical protein